MIECLLALGALLCLVYLPLGSLLMSLLILYVFPTMLEKAIDFVDRHWPEKKDATK